MPTKPPTPNKRPGRPRLPDEEKRTEVLTLKFSKHEKGLVFAAAQSAGYAPYAWSRTKLIHAAKLKLGLP